MQNNTIIMSKIQMEENRVEKRERSDIDEEDERNILQKVENYNYTSYLAKSKEEKEELGLMGIAFLPVDVKKIIGTLEPGLLLSLAQKNRLFLELASSEWVWRNMFKRHFPVDYEYCGGELPFFVLDNVSHPLRGSTWTINNVPVEPPTSPGWKRFYLHVRQDYVNAYTGNDRIRPNFASMYKIVMYTINELAPFNLGHYFDVALTFFWSFMKILKRTYEPDETDDWKDSFFRYTEDAPWLRKYYMRYGNDHWNTVDTKSLFTLEDQNLFAGYMHSRQNDWRGFRRVRVENREFFVDSFIRLFNVCAKRYHNLCILSVATSDEEHINRDIAAFSIVYSEMIKIVVASVHVEHRDLNMLLHDQNAIRYYIASPDTALTRTRTVEFVTSLAEYFITYNEPPRTETGKIFLIQSECVNCGITAPDMSVCAACKTQVYCGKACQKQHWPTHKTMCK